MPDERVQLVPGVHKAVLGKIVRKHSVTRELSQKISNLRLVAANQFTKRRRILLRHCSRNKVIVVCAASIQRSLSPSLPGLTCIAT